MPSARLDALRRQFTEVRTGIETIEAAATSDNRDLTDAENVEVATLHTRAEQLRPTIEAAAREQESLDATAAILARIQPQTSVVTRTVERPEQPPQLSFAEYLCARYQAERKGSQFAIDLLKRTGLDDLSHTQSESFYGELLARTVAQQKTTDNVGILPVPIVGPLMDFRDTLRPVTNSMTQRAHPGTKTWTRPELYQHVAIGEQVNELDELASQSFKITGDIVTSKTYGGTLEISEQDIDFTDPGALQIMLQDFGEEYARATEIVACTALVALPATTFTYTTTNIGTIINSFVTGINAIYTQAEVPADTIWLSRDIWASLASGVTALEQPVLNVLTEALNKVANVSFVLGNRLPTNTMVIGASIGVEAYERNKGFVQQVDVSHLGVVVAYRGYFTVYGKSKLFTKKA
jgi:hypothetical protein